MSKIEITANANVAMKQAGTLVNELTGDHQHQARILYFVIEAILEKLEALPDSSHRVQALNNQISQLESSVSLLEQDKEQALDENDKLKASLATLNQDLENAAADREKLHQADDERQTLEAERDQAINKANGLDGEVKKLKSKLAETEKAWKAKVKTTQQRADADVSKAKEKSKQAVDKEKEKLRAQKEAYDKMVKERNELARDLARYNGSNVQNDHFKGKSPGVSFFIHEFSSPLKIKILDNSGISPLDDCQWHYQVMRSNGISVNIGVTEWLSPVIPESDEFKSEWNPAISDRLHELMLERAKETHPETYQRVMAAKGEYITNLDVFDESEQTRLKKAKLISLYDAVSLTKYGFTTKIRAQDPNISDEAVTLLRDKIGDIAREFEKKRTTVKEKNAA